MKFYEESKKYIEYKNKKHPVDLSFNSVLDCMEIIEDPIIADEEKIDLLAWRLFKRNPPKNQKESLVIKALDVVSPKNESTEEQTIDLDQDREYIRAGFRQAYGINLDEQIGAMHWNEFIGLLQSLPSSTKMSEIVNIRMQPIPKRDKYNGQQINELVKAKRAVAIKKKTGNTNYAKSLENMFGMLKTKAKGGG